MVLEAVPQDAEGLRIETIEFSFQKPLL